MAAPPAWLTIQPPTRAPDATVRRLQAGERDALLLMYEGVAPLFLTDDGSAYRVALRQRVPVIRTLRLLEMAAEQGLIDLPTMLTRLEATTFYAPTDVMIDMRVRDVLRKDAARKAAAQET